MNNKYAKLPDHWKYWCCTHQRRATSAVYSDNGSGRVCCDPQLGGILIGCITIDVTDIVLTEKTKDQFLQLVMLED